MAENENKISKSYSLSAENIEWLRGRAMALSTVERRLSDSLFLDNLITAKREEQERVKKIFRSVKLQANPHPQPLSRRRGGEKEVTG